MPARTTSPGTITFDLVSTPFELRTATSTRCSQIDEFEALERKSERSIEQVDPIYRAEPREQITDLLAALKKVARRRSAPQRERRAESEARD
jgi:non-homologous end joining protein Ku